MKTIRKVPIELVEVEFIPKDMEFGKLYYSREYKVSNHLCVCGCGMQAPIPIQEGEWSIDPNGGKVNVTPSLQHLNGCRSHYIITNGFANIV